MKDIGWEGNRVHKGECTTSHCQEESSKEAIETPYYQHDANSQNSSIQAILYYPQCLLNPSDIGIKHYEACSNYIKQSTISITV
jgi:hypothetical protein